MIKMPSIGSFTLWVGCVLAVIFAILLIRTLVSGPKEIPDTLHLHDTYFVSYSPWMLLAPLLGALLILVSGWMMKTSEADVERINREIQNQGEHDEGGKASPATS